MQGHDNEEALNRFGNVMAALHDQCIKQVQRIVCNPADSGEMAYVDSLKKENYKDVFVAGCKLGLEVFLHDLMVKFSWGGDGRLLIPAGGERFIDPADEDDIELQALQFDWLEKFSEFGTEFNKLMEDRS